MTTESSIQVFVSSTKLDLLPERAAVEKAIRSLRETDFKGMEIFGTRDEDTRAASLAEVDRSHVYVGIVAGRYGSGITEAEYRRARTRGLNCLIYFKSEHAITPEQRDADPLLHPRLEAWKRELRGHHTVVEFSEAEELAKLVVIGLHNWLHERHSVFLGSTLPFEAVETVDRLFGSDTSAASFGPSRREFEKGLVHRPALMATVLSDLEKNRFACVLGKGASGKTTLALSLAYHGTYGAQRTYYFDLADETGGPERAEDCHAAILAIAQRHGREALVIIDNIHLAERLAAMMHASWMESGRPVHLLMLGRLTAGAPDPRGRQSPAASLRALARALEVDPDDLLGVLRRLASRRQRDLPALPAQDVQNWLRLFGGDLIAFGFAANSRLHALLRGEPRLTETDAADYVRAEYLDNPRRPIAREERENLLTIAAFSDAELAVPREALPHPGHLVVNLQQGLVWQSVSGRDGRFVRFRFHHPGMGRLIWEAAASGSPKLERQCDTAARYPFFGIGLGFRLSRMSESPPRGDIQAVLAAAVGTRDAFERLTEHGLSYLEAQLELLLTYEIVTQEQVAQRLRDCPGLVKAAMATPLGHLRHFLEYADRRLPDVFLAIANGLNDPARRDTLVQAALGTPLGDLRHFLEYAEKRLPSVFTSIENGLTDPARRDVLVQTALGTPLGDLRHFLKYAEKRFPGVFTAIVKELNDPARRDALVQSALATPVHFLGNFLEYVEKRLPLVYTTILNGLNDPARRDALVQSALATPVHFLGNFLEYVEKRFPSVFTAIESGLNDPARRDALVQAALVAPLEHLRRFLEYAEKRFPSVFTAIESGLNDPARRDALVQAALVAPLEHLRRFLEYAEKRFPSVFTAIESGLNDPARRDALVQTALVTPLDHLRGFLGYAERQLPGVFRAIRDALSDLCADAQRQEAFARTALATECRPTVAFMRYAARAFPEVAKAINEALAGEFRRGGMEHRHLVEAIGNPALLPSLEPLLRGCGCADLIETVAQATVVRLAQASEQPSDLSLGVASSLLRLARHAPEATVAKFLDLAITPEWLHANFTKLAPLDIAMALQVLWSSTPPDVCQRFRHASLKTRVSGLARNLHTCSKPERGGPILELIGACSLFGIASLSWIKTWPSPATVSAFIETNDAGTAKQHISAHRALFLIGLRTLARHASTDYIFPPATGPRILTQWQATVTENPNHQNLNAWMIAWLEKCAMRDWRLLRDATPAPKQVPAP